MKKRLAIAGGILIALLLALGLAFWYFINKPLYAVGMARTLGLTPPAQTAETDFWTVEPGIRLHHFEEGAGPGVLVVHGGPGYPFHAPIGALKPLAGRYRFVYYDQRGSGKSTRPIDRFQSQNYYGNLKRLDGALGLAAQVADMERIRRILGEDRLVLLGHSFGGFLASLYAAEFPEHVKALVLVAPATVLVMPSAEGNLMEKMADLLPASERPGYAAFLKRYFDYGTVFAKSEADHQALNAEFAKYYLVAAAARGFKPPESLAAPDQGGWMTVGMYFGMGRRHDYRPPLKKVTAPVLVMHGGSDLQPESATRTYADAFPNAKLVVLPKAGHFMFEDAPEAFAAAVGGFLDGVK